MSGRDRKSPTTSSISTQMLRTARLAHPGHTERGNDVVGFASRHAVDLRLPDDREHRAVDPAPGLDQGGHVPCLPDLRDPQVDRVGKGVPDPVAVTVGARSELSEAFVSARPNLLPRPRAPLALGRARALPRARSRRPHRRPPCEGSRPVPCCRQPACVPSPDASSLRRITRWPLASQARGLVTPLGGTRPVDMLG